MLNGDELREAHLAGVVNRPSVKMGKMVNIL